MSAERPMKLVQLMEEELYQGYHTWEAMVWKDVVGCVQCSLASDRLFQERVEWGHWALLDHTQKRVARPLSF